MRERLALGDVPARAARVSAVREYHTVSERHVVVSASEMQGDRLVKSLRVTAMEPTTCTIERSGVPIFASPKAMVGGFDIHAQDIKLRRGEDLTLVLSEPVAFEYSLLVSH